MLIIKLRQPHLLKSAWCVLCKQDGVFQMVASWLEVSL